MRVIKRSRQTSPGKDLVSYVMLKNFRGRSTIEVVVYLKYGRKVYCQMCGKR